MTFTRPREPVSGDSLLLTPVELGDLVLRNRIVMSPMSRLRSDTDGVPPTYMADYYAQRAGAGLIITETIAVAPYGDGYPQLPGLFTAQQVRAWQEVTRAVHSHGSLITAQLWHVGRARFEQKGREYQPAWATLSEVRPDQLRPTDLADMVQGFEDGARAAERAGFDSVEIHAGNGFLLDRFLRAATNTRTDAYGGPAHQRTRLLRQILAAVIGVFGNGRVGLRLSPSAMVNGGPDPEADKTFASLLDELTPLGLGYVHSTRVTSEDRAHGSGPGLSHTRLREFYGGTMIGAGEYTQNDGEQAIASGTLNAVAYGRLFLANPDLPTRFALRAPLNAPNAATFYTPGTVGLTDYPTLSNSAEDPSATGDSPTETTS